MDNHPPEHSESNDQRDTEIQQLTDELGIHPPKGFFKGNIRTITEQYLSLDDEQAAQLDERLKSGELPSQFPIAHYEKLSYKPDPAGKARYLLDDQFIAQGGQGGIYRGWDVKLDRPVALKISLAEKDPSYPDELQPEYYALEREAQVSEKLSHPSILKVYDYIETHGQRMMVSELLDPTLFQGVDKKLGDGPVPLEDTLNIIDQLCDALDYAKSQNLFHRDIKPQNLMYDSTNKVLKLIDFGISNWAIPTNPDVPASIATTYAYAAPETLHLDETAGLPAEVYSVGATVYEMLTGQSLFGNKDNDVRQMVKKRMDYYKGDFEWAFFLEKLQEQGVDEAHAVKAAEVIHQAIDFYPENRQQTAAEFAQQLRSALETFI